MNSNAEYDFLKPKITTEAMVGLSDDLVEGTFKWVDDAKGLSVSGNNASNDFAFLANWITTPYTYALTDNSAWKRYVCEIPCSSGVQELLLLKLVDLLLAVPLQ